VAHNANLGEHVLVTGGASGLGAAVAGAASRSGSKVTVLDRQASPDGFPPPDLKLSSPDAVAEAVVFALSSPRGTEVRELVVTPPGETSWP